MTKNEMAMTLEENQNTSQKEVIHSHTPKNKKQEVEDTPNEKENSEKETISFEEKKKVETPKKKITLALVNSYSVPVSTKTSIEICRFIKGKSIDEAIRYLEDVTKLKKAIPMRGEIPHRKGKGMSSGRFPINAAKHFILILKSLAANSAEIDNPIIHEAVANIASKPFGRFGRTRKKRTHIRIISKDKKQVNIKKENKNGRKKNG